jgi:hypothetical protein
MDRLLDVTAVVSAILLLIVLASVRRAHIRPEYSVSWLLGTSAILVLSLARPLLNQIRALLGLPDTPLAVFLLAGAVFLVVFFRFTVIVSHLRDDNIKLAQRVAILEHYLHRLEKANEG